MRMAAANRGLGGVLLSFSKSQELSVAGKYPALVRNTATAARSPAQKSAHAPLLLRPACLAYAAGARASTQLQACRHSARKTAP